MKLKCPLGHTADYTIVKEDLKREFEYEEEGIYAEYIGDILCSVCGLYYWFVEWVKIGKQKCGVEYRVKPNAVSGQSGEYTSKELRLLSFIDDNTHDDDTGKAGDGE